MSTLEDIANGVSSNVFTAGSNAALAALELDIFDAVCAQARSGPSFEVFQSGEIINLFVYQAASKYKNKFNTIPTWFPGYQAWQKGELEYFTYKRKN